MNIEFKNGSYIYTIPSGDPKRPIRFCHEGEIISEEEFTEKLINLIDNVSAVNGNRSPILPSKIVETKDYNKVIFRPHRSTLSQAMAESKEFNSVNEMLNYICEKHNYNIPWFQLTPEEIYIEKQSSGDERVGWHNLYYLMFERRSKIKNLEGLMLYFGIKDDPSLPDDDRDTYMINDEPIGVIGMFSTDYDKE